jgi:hypothetical protein
VEGPIRIRPHLFQGTHGSEVRRILLQTPPAYSQPRVSNAESNRNPDALSLGVQIGKQDVGQAGLDILVGSDARRGQVRLS